MGEEVLQGGLVAAERAERPRPLSRSVTAASTARSLTPAETAWLAAIPTAALVLLGIVLLGAPLGRTLLAPSPARFFALFQVEVRPEPVEQGRFLVALTAPLILTALTIAGTRRRLPATRVSDVLIPVVQAAAVGLAVICLLQQNEFFGPLYPPAEMSPLLKTFFTPAALVVAAVGTVALVVALRRGPVRAAWVRIAREGPGRRGVVGAVAVAAIAVWLTIAINTEGTIGAAYRDVGYHIQFPLDETFAVLDGRSPLVNFAAQYGSLWPYGFAGVMSLLGTSVGVWVALAVSVTGLGMLAIYGVLRRVAHSSLVGLLLFLPVLASSFSKLDGSLENRYSYANYYGTFPLRYAGPSILAWLVARHLGDIWPRRIWPLFLVAGLVALNNADVGVAALGATVAAVLWGGGRLTRRRSGWWGLEAAGGLAAAFALVSVLTLARAGALPDLGLLLRYARLFASSGFAMYPMPTVGLHLVLYATFVAAIGVATVRALRPDTDRLLTGMLAWSGVFGLGAGAYFTGRSTPANLEALLFPWSLAIALLVLPAVREIALHGSWRQPPIAAVACVFVFLAMACTLVQTPTPWSQIDRLRSTVPPILAAPLGQRFIADHTDPGESVAILGLLGHRIGTTLGVENVSLYSNSLSMPTVEQFDETIAALRRAGGRKIFLTRSYTTPEMQVVLTGAGFAFDTEDPRQTTLLWVDKARG
ncbi:MAG TPA: hypothetical protein VGO48_15340 [Conexibacter sp.]|jgi:hypothetical protein|nr:hypothetical protein [Conexibacter sp.]